MVGFDEVVIHRFRDAEHTHFIIRGSRHLADFVGGIHRIVAAVIKKVADVMRLEHRQNAFHILVIQFTATGAERRRRRLAQAFDSRWSFFAQID